MHIDALMYSCRYRYARAPIRGCRYPIHQYVSAAQVAVTTHQYLETDLATNKGSAVKRIKAQSSAPVRFQALDKLRAFVDAL
jgi:hypothetical protein